MAVAVLLAGLSSAMPFCAGAKEKKIDLIGQYFEFEKDSEYEVDTARSVKTTDKSQNLGTLTLDGDITKEYVHEGFPAYEISENEVFSLQYTYDDTFANAAETDEHLIEDGKKIINGVKLDSKIKKGAVILQTSLDGETWVTKTTFTDVADNVTFDEKNAINTAQLINGCWYRVIVAYETGKKHEGQFSIFDLFNSFDSTEKKKYAEVYRIYANYPVVEGKHPKNEHIYKTSEYTSRTKKNDYVGNEPSNENDPHRGWELGKFVLSGYTSVTGESGNIYQKTLGDRIELKFHLSQDISMLDGKEYLIIEDDKNGYDGDPKLSQKPHDMGHGELIVWHKPPNGDAKITSYSNYLEALVSPNADTSIVLYEEGDYEVHLDYAVSNTKGIKKTCYYRTSFSFKIESGNVMGFLFDEKNGRELFKGDRTEYGFRIDNANSQSLNIHVERKILYKSADGWALDTRGNTAAAAGDTFEDVGMYEITWTSKSDPSGKINSKILYVGDSETIEKYKNFQKYGTIETPSTTTTVTTTQSTTTTAATTNQKSTSTKASASIVAKTTATFKQTSTTTTTTTTKKSSR